MKNKKFTEVNKNLGDKIQHTFLKRCKAETRYKIKDFISNRTNFTKALKAAGYHTYMHGNYIEATKDNETNTIFFISHSNGLHNYLIPRILDNRVNYFAFYDENKKCAYMVAYNKVREYCQTLTFSCIFYGHEKLLIPDEWAKKQVINKFS